MTTAIARNDFDYLDRPFAAQDYSPARSQKTAESTSAPSDVAKTDTDGDKEFWGKDGFGFDDFLDIINPLQHIPVISTLYREFTGDELSPGARMVGGGIFGGGIGLASSVINSAIEMETGKDVGGHVMALFSGDEEETPVLAEAKSTTEAPKVALSPAPSDNTSPALQAASPAPTAAVQAPMPTLQLKEDAPKLQAASGLEWKDAPPNLQKGLQRLQQVQGQNLTDAQMSQLLGAFNGAQIISAPASSDDKPSKPAAPEAKENVTPAPTAARAYEAGRDVSDFAYMDRAI